MIIKKICIGNDKEAFVNDEFRQGVNIISSNDNNKGKTIAIQAIMYCFGNKPAFPTSFEYQDYYYILELEHDDNNYFICRKKDNFVVYHNNINTVFDNISEFKRYWNKHIKEIPLIKKNNIMRLVDPELYVQLFFVGQDKKMTYDIINSGYYRKDDFYSVLFSIKGILDSEASDVDTDKIKKEMNSLKNEKDILIKENKILQKSNTATEFLSSINDKIFLKNKIKEIDDIKNKLLALRKDRNKAISRKSKNELVLKELRSLNRTMKTGEIKCLDCGSKHITYESSDSDFTFDISTKEMRNQILTAIQEKIDIYQEEIDKLTVEINVCQQQFDESIPTDEVTFEAILIMKKEIAGSIDADKRISEIDKKLQKIKEQLEIASIVSDEIKEKRKDLLKKIVAEMNSAYNSIDLCGKSDVYKDIFSSRDKIYSGSEATEFHLSRMIALEKLLEHGYPIIVDSFRAEDLSTERENRVIDLFKNINIQVILTTTLKDEEQGKYNLRTDINHIDFSNHVTNKMLSEDYLNEFINTLSMMKITI